MWYPYTMEHYSAIETNWMMPFAARLMDLDTIKLTKSHRERQTYDIIYRWNEKSYKWTFLQIRNRLTDIENKLIVTKAEMRRGIN